MKSADDATCQSTPELSCSNERERERHEPAAQMEETHGLSASGTLLSSTSLTGLTPTSSGTIDDKNEVCTCSFPLLRILLYHRLVARARGEKLSAPTERICRRSPLFFLLLSPSPLASLSPNDSITNTSYLYIYGMSNVIPIMSDEKTSHSPPLIRATTPVPNERSATSHLSLYAVRRHHSAPQQECRWQQVPLSLTRETFDRPVCSRARSSPSSRRNERRSPCKCTTRRSPTSKR